MTIEAYEAKRWPKGKERDGKGQQLPSGWEEHLEYAGPGTDFVTAPWTIRAVLLGARRARRQSIWGCSIEKRSHRIILITVVHASCSG